MRSMDEHPDFPQPVPGTDPCGPPLVPTLVHCIHCGQEYDSYLIKWVVTPNHEGKLWGHWICPIPGCDGAGFCIDIWPVDPEWRNEHGEKVCFTFDDDEESDDIPFDDDADDFADELPSELEADNADETWSPPTTPN
jgi:hypothetical protein